MDLSLLYNTFRQSLATLKWVKCRLATRFGCRDGGDMAGKMSIWPVYTFYRELG